MHFVFFLWEMSEFFYSISLAVCHILQSLFMIDILQCAHWKVQTEDRHYLHQSLHYHEERLSVGVEFVPYSSTKLTQAQKQEMTSTNQSKNLEHFLKLVLLSLSVLKLYICCLNHPVSGGYFPKKSSGLQMKCFVFPVGLGEMAETNITTLIRIVLKYQYHNVENIFQIDYKIVKTINCVPLLHVCLKQNY